MERRSWLWKRKSSDRSPGETESSGSISSHSERYSDEQVEQEGSKESPNHMQSPEVTSKVAIMNEEVHDSVKSLAEKLSAALVNVGAKEDLVKQHAKVAEEAVAGWEKAENEITMLKQQLEAAVQQNLALEVRVNHLDGALKECVRQLRQARDEQEQRIHEAVEEKTCEWESTKGELETQFRDLQTQLLDLQTQAEATKSQYHPPIDSNVHLKLETLERENSILKFELLTQSEELEILTIERDLSTQAAETASKQQLESIKKVAKLEAECRRLQALARKSPSINDHKAVSISSLGVDSLTDSQSDSGERLNAIEIDTFKMGKVENNDSEPSCSDSWASALIAELDQFKNGKVVAKNVALPEIDIMDDFLEMERLAALPENQSKTHCSESENVDNSLRAELEAMGHQVAELEEKLEKLEAEKVKLENALSMRQDSLAASEAQLAKTENRMVDLQKELTVVNESRELLEFQLASMEAESHTMSTKVDSLKADVEKERSLSAEMAVKCQELEKELTRKAEEVELLQHTASSNGEAKEKQEELAVVAADRLAECQKTISSLARQLESLATLEDFLIDTANLPGISIGSSIPRTGGELWKLHSNDTFMPKSNSDCSKQPEENLGPLINGNAEESPSSSSSSTSSAVSLTHVKSKSSLGKLFSRSKSGIQVENRRG